MSFECRLDLGRRALDEFEVGLEGKERIVGGGIAVFRILFEVFRGEKVVRMFK